MTALLTMGWTGADTRGSGRRSPEIARDARRGGYDNGVQRGRRPGAERASTMTPRSPSATARATRSRLAPGRETVIGAYSGAPYNYPSSACKIGSQAPTIFTIDPVTGTPTRSKARSTTARASQRWFTGGRDRGHGRLYPSKAIAPAPGGDRFSGTLDGSRCRRARASPTIVPKFEFSHGHNMLLFTGLCACPASARASALMRAPAPAYCCPTPRSACRRQVTTRTYEYNYAGPAAQALLGVEIRLARVSLFVEYKFTWGHYEAPLSQVDGSWLFEDLWRQLQRWRPARSRPAATCRRRS